MLNHITMFQPSAIDNALSTMQILHKLITQINTVIDEVNSIDSKANEYTDEQINTLKDFLLNKINNDIKTLTKYIDNQDKKNYNILDKKIDDVIKQVYIDIAKLKSDLILYIDDNDDKIKVIINEVYDELFNLIRKGNSAIYSPVDGNLKSTQDAFIDVMNIVQQKNGVSWDIIQSLCNDTTPSKRVTYDSLLNHMKEMSYMKTWNSLAYYTCECLDKTLYRVDGTKVPLANLPMTISSLQYNFY